MSHPVIEFLQANHPNGLSKLQEIGVYSRQSTVHPKLSILNYDQIEAKEDNRISNCCRGLIIEIDGDKYTIIAQPFARFFNASSGHAAQLDWSSPVEFYEKLDGTLCIVYFYDGIWNVATRSMPDATIPCQDGRTYAEKFWQTLSPYTANQLIEKFTYCFEYCGPDNQICVQYNKPSVTLLGCFTTDTGVEIPVENLTGGFNLPRVWTFESLDEATSYMEDNTNGTDFEGFVVRDSNGCRVKLKSQKYLSAARTIQRMSTDADLLEAILLGIDDDVIVLLDDVKSSKIKLLKDKLTAWIERIDSQLNAYQDRHDCLSDKSKRKAYALYCLANAIPMGPAMYPGNVGEWVRDNMKMGKPSFVEKMLKEISGG